MQPRLPIRIGFHEFLVLIAALMATQAVAIDSMLPALSSIAGQLGVHNQNHAQWIVTAYASGIGLGQLFWGVVSDRFGRRPVLLGGLALYAIAALLCGLTRSFHALLGWRLLHGTAAASLVISRSVVRDLYTGRQMARVMSLTFIVFLMVPILAPSLGQLILWLAPWRFLFIMLGGFAALVGLWVWTRLPETLHPEYRLTVNRRQLGDAVRLVLGTRLSIYYALAMTALYGSLLAYVGMVQQIFATVFQRASLMPAVFALCAGGMGVASFLNSRIVERLGMRLISHTALLAFIAVTATHTLIAVFGHERLWTFVLLQAATMATFGLTFSNFGAMAMEPVGAVAGIGASLQGFMTTLGGALIGALIGRGFEHSTTPLAAGALICGLAALVFVLLAERGRLFHARHAYTGQTL